MQGNLLQFSEYYYEIVVSKIYQGGGYLVRNQRYDPQGLQEGNRMISVFRNTTKPRGHRISMYVNGLAVIHLTVKEAKQLAEDLNAAIREEME